METTFGDKLISARLGAVFYDVNNVGSVDPLCNCLRSNLLISEFNLSAFLTSNSVNDDISLR